MKRIFHHTFANAPLGSEAYDPKKDFDPTLMCQHVSFECPSCHQTTKFQVPNSNEDYKEVAKDLQTQLKAMEEALSFNKGRLDSEQKAHARLKSDHRKMNVQDAINLLERIEPENPVGRDAHRIAADFLKPFTSKSTKSIS